MSLSRETQEMLQNAITKMTTRYISAEESKVTDFQIRVNGDNGELTIFDDDDNSLARVHIKNGKASTTRQCTRRSCRANWRRCTRMAHSTV